MEISVVRETQVYTDLFRQGILEDLTYWQSYLKDKANHQVALQSKIEQIIKHIQFALGLEAAWYPIQTLIETFSPYVERYGYWEIWNEILNRAIQVAEQRPDQSAEVRFSILLARLLFQQSHFNEASRQYRKTIQLARRLGDQVTEARACSNLGFYFIELGQWHRAEVLCCYALQLFQHNDNNHGLAHTHNHLGMLYTRQHHWQPAEWHLKQACAIWKTMEDDHGLMRGFLNLSALYSKTEQFDSALHYLEQAQHQAQITGEAIQTGTIWLNRAIVSRKAGDPVRAEGNAWQAEAIFRQFSNRVGLAQVQCVLGLIYIDRQKWSEAKVQLEISLDAARTLHNRYVEAEALIGFVKYELARGDRGQAAIRLKKLETCIEEYFGNKLYNEELQQLRTQMDETFPEATASQREQEAPS